MSRLSGGKVLEGLLPPLAGFVSAGIVLGALLSWMHVVKLFLAGQPAARDLVPFFAFLYVLLPMALTFAVARGVLTSFGDLPAEAFHPLSWRIVASTVWLAPLPLLSDTGPVWSALWGGIAGVAAGTCFRAFHLPDRRRALPHLAPLPCVHRLR